LSNGYIARTTGDEAGRSITTEAQMDEPQATNRSDLLALTAELVSAHLSNNRVEATALPGFIGLVYEKLRALSEEPEARVDLVPAVPIRKSVTDDYIICLEDGKKLKMLKRHLMTAYGMTPEEYRTKWGLRSDYPMVAPNYAAKRQELAKKIGLGRKRADVPPVKPTPVKPAPKRRSRKAA
jgi:predicted transcriptional regulator